MTTLASAILADAGILLSDTAATRWTSAELLSWLNAGQIEIATRVPNSNSVTTVIQLIAGAKQTLPVDALRAIEFVRNMGATGTTPGAAIWPIDRKDMDAYWPNWSSDTANVVVQHALYNAEDDNETFYVWPPQPATGMNQIEIIYAKTPAYLTATTQNITLSDYYRNPLLDYVLYRAFNKDAEYANQADRSARHYKAFADFLGIKYTIDTNSSNAKQGGK